MERLVRLIISRHFTLLLLLLSTYLLQQLLIQPDLLHCHRLPLLSRRSYHSDRHVRLRANELGQV